MKGITTTYRMTNKPLPVRHSPYVVGILRPVKVLIELWVCGLKDVRSYLIYGFLRVDHCIFSVNRHFWREIRLHVA